MRYFIELAYDGTSYFGWQAQDNAETIQQKIELALKHKLRLEAKITGCGRTDAGVHARQYFAHFDTPEAIGIESPEMAVRAMNGFLPDDIAVYRIFRVKDQAHARFDATERTYKYYINTLKDPFGRHYAWNFRLSLNIAAMNQAAQKLIHHKDFTSFAKLHTDTKTNLCNVKEAHWEEQNGLLVFTISADRFLRNMVRAIVGTMFDVGRGKSTPDNIDSIIAGQNRNLAGMSAPANGLFLHQIHYNWNEILD